MTGKSSPAVLKDRVILLLVNGMGAEAAEAWCIQNAEDPSLAHQIVADARQRLTVAADFHRDEQLGKAVIRLDDLYAKSIASQDIRTALQAQRELNRLLSLYSGGAREESTTEDATALRRQVDLIASYLLPLKLADEQYPVEEHARLASEILRRQIVGGVQSPQGPVPSP